MHVNCGKRMHSCDSEQDVLDRSAKNARCSAAAVGDEAEPASGVSYKTSAAGSDDPLPPMDCDSSPEVDRQASCAVDKNAVRVVDKNCTERSVEESLSTGLEDQGAKFQRLRHVLPKARQEQGCGSDSAQSNMCSICRESLSSVADDHSLVVHLECGHAYHGYECLAPYIGSVCAQVQKRVREDLYQRSAEMGLEGAARSALLGGLDLADLHAQGRLRQCPRCTYGPVVNIACSDMRSHDANRGSGTDRTTNACPTCGFYSASWEDWSAWDPEDVISSVRCPLCRGPCRLVKEDVPRVRAHLQKHLPSDNQGRTRFELLIFGRDVADMLTLLSALCANANADVQGQEDFHRFPQALAEMAGCRGEVAIILAPLFEKVRQFIAAGDLRSLNTLDRTVQVESQSTAQAPSAFGGIHTAINVLRELLPLESKYNRAWRQGELQLCMAISEEMKPALDKLVGPVASDNPALFNDMHRLTWTANGFRNVPNLTALLQVFEAHLPSWCSASSAPTILRVVTSRDMSVQTDDLAEPSRPIVSVSQLVSLAQTSIDALVDAAARLNVRRNMAVLLRGAAEGQMPTHRHEFEVREELQLLTLDRRLHHGCFLDLVRIWRALVSDEHDLFKEFLVRMMHLLDELRHRHHSYVHHSMRMESRPHLVELRAFGTQIDQFHSKLSSVVEKNEVANVITAREQMSQLAQLLMQWVLLSSVCVLHPVDAASASASEPILDMFF